MLQRKRRNKSFCFQRKMSNQDTAGFSLSVEKMRTQVYLIYLFVKNTLKKYLNKQNNQRVRLCNAKDTVDHSPSVNSTQNAFSSSHFERASKTFKSNSLQKRLNQQRSIQIHGNCNLFRGQ